MNQDPVLQRRRARRHLMEAAVVAGMGLLIAAYVWIPAVRVPLNLVATPAVEGITMGYSAFSTVVHRKTGLDLGLVKPEIDPAFQEKVRVATYVNERRAGPLIDFASDKRNPDDARDAALRTLLKFPDSTDWIQPLLNELPKGGLVGLYNRDTPTLNDLFSRVREEGGVQEPLIRAYAELVFSFMLQVPDALLRSHAFRWLSDVLPEDALTMIVARIPEEKDGEVRRQIEHALLAVRVIPKPESAAGALLPFYRDPPWVTLKTPVAVILARLGDKGSTAYLRTAQRDSGLSDAERTSVNAALSGSRYPTRLDTTRMEELVARRDRERREQAQAAVIKRDRLERQERLQQELLSRATSGAAAAAPVQTDEVPNSTASKPLSMRLPVDRAFVVTTEAPLYLNPGDVRTPFTLPVGTEVRADVQATANGRTWYQVSTAQGGRWVDAVALETPEQAKFLSQAGETELEVADGRIPVYGEASSLARVVGSLGKGHVIHVLRADKVNSEQWFEIKLDRGSSGWIRGDLSLRLKVSPTER